jgi:predicted DNA-binding protein with PD1-like motif
MKHRFLLAQLALPALFIFCPVVPNVIAQQPTTAPAKKASQHSTTSVESGEATAIRVFALRLRPGQDLRQQIEAFVKQKHIRAGFIITTVGSLKQAALRLADQPSTTSFAGKFEIVSLVGTLGQDGMHLHLSISDNTGKTIGGHLVEGCLIYTTAEIVIGEAEGLIFSREKDPETTYQELRIRRRAPPRRN